MQDAATPASYRSFCSGCRRPWGTRDWLGSPNPSREHTIGPLPLSDEATVVLYITGAAGDIIVVPLTGVLARQDVEVGLVHPPDIHISVGVSRKGHLGLSGGGSPPV